MKVTIIQNRICETVEQTLELIKSTFYQQEPINSDFIVFPEMFTTPYELKYFISHRQSIDGPVIRFLSEIARQHKSYVIGGSIPYLDGEKIFNTTFVFDRAGMIIARYDKIHLFEIEYPDGKTFREADVLSSGNIIGTFETEYGTMGVEICFDIRFPELTSLIEQSGAKIIFVPAAFNDFTGPLHWRTTFRARAIDNQLFMIGCSPSDDGYGNYHVYGHSLGVDPLGNVIKELDGEPGMFTVDIDLNQVDFARKTLPILKNKKKLCKSKGDQS